MSSSPVPSAAMRMRESFGDRKIDISRRITACVACRKLKIRCHMNDSGPPCTRCKTRGLSCTLNKSLQTLLESDISWKERIEHRVQKLESVLRNGSTREHDVFASISNEGVPSDAQPLHLGEAAVEQFPIVSTNRPTEGVTLDFSRSLGAFPASMIKSPAISVKAAGRPDVISRGVVSEESAERYFALHKQHLESYMHDDFDETTTLTQIRARSSLLTVAICTVAALSIGSQDYQVCLDALKTEVSHKLFADRYEYDDVRALCIGALWLGDESSALNGLAVRISTQLDLHRCITKMPHTKHACYVRTRLYFQVYLCDHHCSLIYGRPPMTREWKSLKDPKVFLQSRLSMRRDMSLISQVELWAINRRVFEYFGADVESTAASQRLADLEQLNQAYDKWHQDWINMLVVNDQRGGLSQRLSDLYFECAKLHLFSHVFRGPPQAQSSTLSPGGTDHLAQQAYRSALAVVRIAVEGHKSFGWLQRLPFYFGPMIAFACVCIVKASQEHRLDEIQRQEGLSYLYQLPTELRTISMAGTAPHPLLSIAKSLETAVNSHLLSTNDNSERLDGEVWNDIQLDFDILSSEAANWNWNFPAFDDQWMMCPDDVDMLQNNQV